jgi:hypothetical protein
MRSWPTDSDDYKAAPGSFCGLLGLFGRLLNGHKRSAAANEEGAAGFGKFDPSGIPRKQLDSKFILQIADLLAQRGLREMKPVSRPSYAQFLGDSNKIAEMAQLHNPQSPISPSYRGDNK